MLKNNLKIILLVIILSLFSVNLIAENNSYDKNTIATIDKITNNIKNKRDRILRYEKDKMREEQKVTDLRNRIKQLEKEIDNINRNTLTINRKITTLQKEITSEEKKMKVELDRLK